MELSMQQLLQKKQYTGMTTKISQFHHFLFKQSYPGFQCESQLNQDLSPGDVQDLLTTNPHDFKHCKLRMMRHDLAHAKPLNDPTSSIIITGRDHIGRSFPGDEVCVQILSREPQADGGKLTGEVVGLIRRDEECCTFICKMEGNKQLATPINNNMTRIYVVKKKANKIDVRKVQPNSHQWVTDKFIDIDDDQLLVVKVLKWEKHCMYPLGVVTKVLSQKDYLDEIFLKLSKGSGEEDHPPSSPQPKDEEEDDKDRQDFCKEKKPFTIRTFTIDPSDAKDLDDAISVIDKGEDYEIVIHVTDVASYVSKDSEEDETAKHKGRTKYTRPITEEKKTTVFMLSRRLSTGKLSLVPHQDRKAVSLVLGISKSTNRILSSSLTLSRVRSQLRLSYDEADRIILERCFDRSQPLSFSSKKDCVAIACLFAEEHRKCRLEGGWSSGQWSEKSRAQCMVEELMNLYNSAVAEELISNDITRELTPLRCHQKPDHEDFEAFKAKYSALLPFSPYLSHICEVEGVQEADNPTEVWSGEDENVQEEDSEQLFFFTSVIQKMKALSASRDYHTLTKLITSDDIHPSLRPMAKEFQDLQKKAEILRSCTSLQSRLGHFHLQLNAYTCASSPMRRYLDLIIQRLLHSVLKDKKVDYMKSEIDQFCDSSMQQLDSLKDYDLQALKFITATKFSSTVVTKLAVVDQLSLSKHKFEISLPFDQMSEGLTIMYRHLKVVEQPECNHDKKSITLHWKRRVYSFSDALRIKPQSRFNEKVTLIPGNKWRQITSAVKAEDWEKVRVCLEHVKTATNRKPEKQQKETSSQEHFKEYYMELKLGEVLQVQVGMETMDRITTPTVKLLYINPFFEVCLEHARNPTMCFSKDVYDSSKPEYRDYKEYQKIWSGLCQMDTAYNAVEENNSVILQDVKITWPKRDKTNEGNLEGFFQMTQTQKKEWHLEFDLTNCFLCIRWRGQHVKKEEMKPEKHHNGSGCPDLEEPLPFTWVAHGVAFKSSKEEDKEKNNKTSHNIKIHFQINQQSRIKEIPKEIFAKATKFTVEVIPKKIPYVLREHAVAKIKHANDLVKRIAIGNISNELLIKNDLLHSDDHQTVTFLHQLNESQNRAVQKALQNPFTVIQGPPGTGKTVVGLHITHQFYLKNRSHMTKNPPKMGPNQEEEEEPKRRGILYCGPSNKAVDIVAEQLMNLKGVLKPLRIYCDQMEMREFPYPGSDLKLCRRSLRDEKPKEKLRDITLMYLVRKPENPFSEQIREFENLKNVLEFDPERYRKVLKQAQRYELRKHDVILCTCSTALNPNLIQTMDFRQILIDECAMATEPEAFIPLVSHKPEQIVLLGDHKQGRPIVGCARVKELGMQMSLFERYMKQALMLDTQYRMHESICEFPSNEFYNGKLRTGALRGPCRLLNNENNPTAILFAHVKGEEVSLIVSTPTGNENSVSNKSEAEQAVRVADMLVRQSGVKPEDIAILTPYNAQVCTIKQLLEKKYKKRDAMQGVTVCTIMKSQGSEWQYVIVSTVRSCPLSEIKSGQNQKKGWMGKKLGFITDPNQVNIAITRAQNGLCILGNRQLLESSQLWRKLLSHYESQNCVVNSAEDIKVDKVKRRP